MGLKRLLSEVDGEVLAVYSEDEKKLCKKYGFHCVWSENFPIGRKHNNGLANVLDYEWDCLVNIGSDDLINPRLFEVYGDHQAQGLLGVHLYNTQTGEAGLFRNNYPLGAGRMIRRDVIEDMSVMWKIQLKASMCGPNVRMGKGFHTVAKSFARSFIDSGTAKFIKEERRPVRLWAGDQNSALDNSSDTILLTNGVRQVGHVSDEVLVVDLKSEVNIWGFGNYEKVDVDVLEFISTEERDAIRRLR